MEGRKILGWLVALLTFSSILGIMLVWLLVSRNVLLGTYSIAISGFLIFMYAAAGSYKPAPDLGYRPEITVVIPAKNEMTVIESVIKTVFNSDYPQDKVRVIAVDDGSTDNTWEGMRRAKLDPSFSDRLELIRHERNYGKRGALASAMEKAHSEIVVCIDSDSFVNRDAIRLLVQPFQDNRVMAVSGHGEARNKEEGLLQKLQHYWYADSFRLVKGMESRFGIVLCCSGMLAAYRREAIMPIMREWMKEKSSTKASADWEYHDRDSWIKHGLARKLIKSPGEDRILTAFALSRPRARSVYQSNAIVQTLVPETSGKFLKQQVRWTRGWIHGSFLSARFMWRKSLPAMLISYLFQSLLFLSPLIVVLWLFVKPIQGQWIGTLGFFAGTVYVGFLAGLNAWKYQKTSIESAPYRMTFVFISLFVTLTVMLYAIITPWKGGWLTRADTAPKVPREMPIRTEEPLEAVSA
jgi:hyaluronan synthase